MQYIIEGSVCPSDGYLISEQEKEIFKTLLVDARSSLKCASFKQGGVMYE